MWRECIELGIDARKSVLSHCKYLRPLVPPIVHGKKWEEGNTQEMANDVSYFAFEPNAKWHSFKGYGEQGRMKTLVFMPIYWPITYGKIELFQKSVISIRFYSL
mgnify:CR=1 FL=1